MIMCLFEVFGFIGIFNDGGLCFYWIVMQFFCFVLYFYQMFVYQWIFQLVSVVEISGVVCVVWVVVRFMVWYIRMGVWVIGLLCFSGYQIIFDINFLVIRIGVVYFMG